MEGNPGLVSLEPVALVEPVVRAGGFSAVFTTHALEALPELGPRNSSEAPSAESDPAWRRPLGNPIAQKKEAVGAAPLAKREFAKTLEKPGLGIKGVAAATPLSDSLVLAIPAAVLFGLPHN